MNCGNHIALRWVAGNDVLLKVRVMEKVLEGSTVAEQDFDLTACDSISVAVSNSYKQTSVEHALDAEEHNCMVVRLPYTLGVGTYTMEVKMVKDESHVRSFDFAFQVVATDCESTTTFKEVDGCKSASMRVTVQMVPQAMVRGKSAYEEWLELPGNEGKGLQDFIDEVLNLNANAAAALAATEGAERVNATINGVVLTVTDRNGNELSVNTKGDKGDPGTTDYNELENKPNLDVYQPKEHGKGLSENDYTDADKEKLAELQNYDDTELRQMINGRFVVVAQLPTASADTTNKIYLVPSASSKINNVKDEFLTIVTTENDVTTYSWEQIGSTEISISSITDSQIDALFI